MKHPVNLGKLIESLQVIPGIGSHSAERIAYYLLQQHRKEGQQLATSLLEALDKVRNCSRCRNLCEAELCHICANPKRDHHTLCVVESPIDVVAIERSHSFDGAYFVLMGKLSPLDGLGPEELGISEFQALLANQETPIKEVIIATNLTVEGEATAHLLCEITRKASVKCTRIAHGVPFGGELEYTNANTLAQAIQQRTEIDF